MEVKEAKTLPSSTKTQSNLAEEEMEVNGGFKIGPYWSSIEKPINLHPLTPLPEIWLYFQDLRKSYFFKRNFKLKINAGYFPNPM